MHDEGNHDEGKGVMNGGRVDDPVLDDVASGEIARRIERRERILGRLREVVVRQLQYRREPDELDPDAPLFGSGFGLDSLDAVEIVVCLETDYGARASEHELLRGSMRSLNVLCDFVLSHGDPKRVGHLVEA
jgi:acyl carrier protein